MWRYKSYFQQLLSASGNDSSVGLLRCSVRLVDCPAEQWPETCLEHDLYTATCHDSDYVVGKNIDVDEPPGPG